MNFLVAIIAILNPLTILSMWSELTNDVKKRSVRLRTASMLIGFAFIVLGGFLIGGKYILNFFSIDLMVFKVAGGILLLNTGIKMVEGINIKKKQDQDDDKDISPLQLAKIRFRKIIVPMAIPIVVGPGSITTMFLFGVGISAWFDYAVLTVVLAVYLSILLAILVGSSWIEAHIDKIVFTAITRLLGIIVTAIAMQFILEGLGELFPNWLNSNSPIFNPGSSHVKGS